MNMLIESSMYDDIDDGDLISTRISTDSKKWSRYTNETIPFRIADMDFKSPDFLVNEIIERAHKNYFGYTDIPKDLQKNICNWYIRTKNVTIYENNIIISTSVLDSYETLLDLFLDNGDEILFFTPVYTQLMKIARKKYSLAFYDLGDYPYNIDLRNLEKKINERSRIKAIVLCNPHNPIGKIWSSEELSAISNICRRNNILLISDEIHSDLIYSGEKFVSLCSFIRKNDKKMFVLNSPGKTFNISGFKISYIISSSSDSEKVRKAIKEKRLSDIDVISLVAANSLYKNIDLSLQWLKKTMLLIQDNYKFAMDFFKDNKRVYIPEMQATYLLWIKVIGSTCFDSEEMRKTLIQKYGIDLHEGTIFGDSGREYLRMNIACPKKILEEGLNKLKLAIDNYDI